MATIGELLQYGKEVLEQSGNEYAKYERKILLENVLNMTYLQMLMCETEEVTTEQEERYHALLEQRANHYPLQYLVGYAHFMDFTFYVNEHVLIPRSDTEILTELADGILKKFANEGKDSISVLDLCCGSGCIGISLKLYHQNIHLTLSDISEEALDVTRQNLNKYDLNAVTVKSDIFENIPDTFTMIVSNPPYIEQEIIQTLMPEVRDFEPHNALDGGIDGLQFYKAIIKDAVYHLKNNGFLLFEIGYNQGETVSALMKKAGFRDVQIKKDYAGLDRIVYGRKEVEECLTN